MKYIDAEKIRSEVERIKEAGCASPISVCNDILSFIDFLQQEQPNVDFEKAAIDYADKELHKPKDYAVAAAADWWNGCVNGFKSGAKWMAEQGYSQQTYVYANRFNDENEAVIQLGRCSERCPEKEGFLPGDKVIVQIRKAE